MKKHFFWAIILFSMVIWATGCKEKPQPPKELLTYSTTYTISVPEPSGLNLTADGRGFWTVSDETSKIYKLDRYGKVQKTIKIDGFDIEGITTIGDTAIAIVLERTREVVILDTSGKEIMRRHLDLEGEANSGLEGITYYPPNGHFFLLNEKKPSLLIEVDNNLSIIKIDTLNLTKDVSGIFYDNTENILWILSDENQLVLKTGLNGKLLGKMDIDVVQPEGITVDRKNNMLYIVSDNKETLTSYKIN